MWTDGENGDSGTRGRNDSEVAIPNGHSLSVPAGPLTPVPNLPHTLPHINQINFENSPKPHIGNKYVTVNNAIHVDEVVQGRCLGLQITSPLRARRLRCGVAVLVGGAIVIALGLLIYIVSVVVSTKDAMHILDIDLNATWYLRHADWHAMSPSSTWVMRLLALPVKIAVIGHSNSAYCDVRRTCITAVKSIQSDHVELFGQIGPNFLVGGDEGFVFEGAGSNVVGATIAGYNSRIVSIMFVGDYRYDEPTQHQFDHVSILLDVLVKDGILDTDYDLYGECQIRTFTTPPGPNIMSKLHDNFPHWRSENRTKCLDVPCWKYLWSLVRNSSRAERLACAAAMIILVLCVALVVYFTVFYGKEPQDSPSSEPGWYISREDWLAEPYNNPEIDDRYNPLRVVVIQHTVGNQCVGYLHCAAEMRNIQHMFMTDPLWLVDIAYNFQVANDDRVYEGRGWNKEGAHTSGYNRCAVGIGFLGDYRENGAQVTVLQEERLHKLLAIGVDLGFLHPEYRVVAAMDVSDTDSPGENLYQAMQKWPHYDHKRLFANKNCTQINDMPFP